MFDTSNIGYQRAVQRAMAEMRASGSWKAKVLDKIYETMWEGEAKKQWGSLRQAAEMEARQLRMALTKHKADSGLSLARDANAIAQRDERVGNLISGIGVLASGYQGVEDYRAKLEEAAWKRENARRISQYGPKR